jgi:hypothetical protein
MNIQYAAFMFLKNLLLKSILFSRKTHLLFFLNGVLLASFTYFFIESRYEKEFFAAINKYVKSKLPQQYSLLDFSLKAMEVTSSYQRRGQSIFENAEFSSMKASILKPATVDLTTSIGACGSYSIVLARVLKSNGIPVRIGQMKVNGVYGGHIFVEAKTENGWIVLDPSYNLAFKKAGGRYANFTDLQANWRYYSKQVPYYYDHDYQYQDVRYTNWKRIPLLGVAAKSILTFFVGGKRADKISIRTYLLRNYHTLAWFTFFLWLLTLLLITKVYKKATKTFTPKTTHAFTSLPNS